MTEVKVYSSPGCGTCAQVKEYLEKAGTPFTVCDVTQPEYAAEMRKLSVMSVPCTVAGDTLIMGFNKTKLDELIACINDKTC